SDDSGCYGVADPTCRNSFTSKKYKVTRYDQAANSVIGASTTGQGAFAVADPVPSIHKDKKHYTTAGHYGVVRWSEPSYAVTSGKYDSGPWSVADPQIPKATDKLVCVIRALDGTWHRPFTTLELAALQSLVDPADIHETFAFDGKSDSAWRE